MRSASVVVGGWLLAACGSATTQAPAKPAGSAASTAAPSVSQAATAGPSLQGIVAGARKEGQLDLVWDENTMGGAEGAKKYEQGLNKLHGLNLHIQFTTGPSMPEMGLKIVEEYKAKQDASSDVYIGAPPNFVPVLQAAALEPVKWASWAPHVRDPEVLGRPTGEAVTVATQIPCITYNSQRVTGSAVPTTLQDLLQPQYKGRIASTPYAAVFNLLTPPELWGPERTIKYVTALAKQVSGLIRCGETQRITSGEFDMLALDCSTDSALKGHAQGAPLSYSLATDAPVYNFWYMAVPKNSAHPNAAKLFIDYILSSEAQSILYQINFLDLHLLPGSHVAGQLSKLESQGVKFQALDIPFIEQHNPTELSKLGSQLSKILQKRG